MFPSLCASSMRSSRGLCRRRCFRSSKVRLDSPDGFVHHHLVDDGNACTVVQLYHTIESLQHDLPPMLEGLSKQRTPATAAVNFTHPRVVIMGGAFGDDAVNTCRQIRYSDRVVWVQESKIYTTDVQDVADPEEMGWTSGIRMKKCLLDHGISPMTAETVGAGQLWFY